MIPFLEANNKVKVSLMNPKSPNHLENVMSLLMKRVTRNRATDNYMPFKSKTMMKPLTIKCLKMCSK